MPLPGVRGLAAGVRVESNLTKYLYQLEAFARLSRTNVPKLLAAHALEFQTRVQRRTPVDTGRLRNSIHTVLPNTSSDTFTYSDDEGKIFEGALSDASTKWNEVWVGTNVDYALQIEAGHSKQAPAGMFAVTLQEMAGALKQPKLIPFVQGLTPLPGEKI